MTHAWISIEGQQTALTAGHAEGPVCHWQKKHIKSVWRDAYGSDCLFCEKPMYFGKKGAQRNDAATIDHIDSLVLGGRNLVSNVQVICKRCNNLKGGEESKYGRYDRQANVTTGDTSKTRVSGADPAQAHPEKV